MKRSTEHILTTHTGSLPRPPELLDALQRRDRGEADDGGLDARVRDAVADVVRRQAEAGVAVVNDGEACKIGYSTYVTERLERRVARRRRVLPRRPPLRRPRGVPLRDRGRDEGRVRRDPPRRAHPAARLPGPRVHPPSRTSSCPTARWSSPACSTRPPTTSSTWSSSPSGSSA